MFQLFQPWEVGICGLPCLWHANHSPEQEKPFQVADIPFHTQRCSRAPVQIHRALPVRALQPVIILKATIKTIETHVMGLGSIAWLIPTSIPEERKRGVPRVLLLCWAGGDQVELQGIKLRVRRWQQPGSVRPQVAATRLGELQEGPPAPHLTSTLPRVTQRVSDRKIPSSKPVV